MFPSVFIVRHSPLVIVRRSSDPEQSEGEEASNQSRGKEFMEIDSVA